LEETMGETVGHSARAGIALAAVLLAATPGSSMQGADSPLARIEPGRWELRDANNEAVLRGTVCVGDPGLLAQVQHGDAPCSRVVISANARQMVIHYTCPATGFGRSTLLFETPRLLRVDSQGIHQGAPFGFRAEARRVGACRQS
jgi:hypothetical protein